MANCVGNVPRGPNTESNFPCPSTSGRSYNSKVHAGTITSWEGGLCNDPVKTINE